MIADVDESLRRLLAGELGRVPGCPIHQRAQIALDSPTIAESVGDGGARINLYLHEVRENLDARDESFRTVRSAGRAPGEVGKRRAPVHLDLSYLLTVYAGDDARAEHRLLTQVLGVMLRFLALPPRYGFGALDGIGPNTVRLQIAQPDTMSTADVLSLWQAVGARMRPALHVKVTAPYDPFETQWTRGVREALFGLAPADASDGSASVPSTLAPSLGGIVLDGADESPLEGARVRYRLAESASASTWEEVRTDRRGIWSLRVAPGAWALKMDKAGFGEAEAQVLVPSSSHEKAEPVVMALRSLEAAEKARLDAEAMRSRWEGARPDRFVPPPPPALDAAPQAAPSEAAKRNGRGKARAK